MELSPGNPGDEQGRYSTLEAVTPSRLEPAPQERASAQFPQVVDPDYLHVADPPVPLHQPLPQEWKSPGNTSATLAETPTTQEHVLIPKYTPAPEATLQPQPEGKILGLSRRTFWAIVFALGLIIAGAIGGGVGGGLAAQRQCADAPRYVRLFFAREKPGDGRRKKHTADWQPAPPQ